MLPSLPTKALPSELGILIQLAVDDNRPTLLLETASRKPRIIFNNVAFEHVLNECPGISALDRWVAAEVSDSCVPQATPTAAFAGRSWIKKRLGMTYAVIYCSHEFVRPPNNDSQALDRLVQDWIRFPDQVPATEWVRSLQNYNWEDTDIGPMNQWPTALREIVLACMSCPRPRIVYWGNDLIQLYNETASPMFGKAHPASLGNKQADIWGREMYDRTVDLIRLGHKDGKPFHNRERLLAIDRNGFVEEAYWDWFLVPFTGSDGRWICSVNCFNEVTATVFERKRQEVSAKLVTSTAKATTLPALWRAFLGVIDEDADDVSFGLLYTPDGGQTTSKQPSYCLHGSAGFTNDVPFRDVSKEIVNVFEKAQAMDDIVCLEGDEHIPELGIDVAGQGVVNSSFVFAVTDLNEVVLAFVVLGMNPRRRSDDGMKQFVYSLSEVLLKSVIVLQSPVDQRRRLRSDDSLSYHLKLEKLTRQLTIATLKSEKNQQTFARMAEAAPIGMFLYRADGMPLYTNDQFLELLGETREAFYEKSQSGLAWRDCMLPEDYEYTTKAWLAATQAQEVITIEFRVKERVDAQFSPARTRWLEVVVSPQRDPHGNLETLQGYLCDISARKLNESLAAERLHDALETKRASENFIDMVCHEIRNPLSSILQLADVITTSLPDELPQDVHEVLADAAQTINICAIHQKTIIDEVLTFSKLDSNLLVLATERVQPRIVVERALKMFETELVHADIETSIERIPNDCEISEVLCDPGRLLQVIINLLTNAIKFTRNSSTRHIKVSYGSLYEPPKEEECDVTFIKPRKKDHEEHSHTAPASPIFPAPLDECVDDDLYLYFSVGDTGCGLTCEESQQLFQRFAQASPKTYKQYGGSGLGLFICRELIELQSGMIGMDSKHGQGSKFAFYIKAKPALRDCHAASISSVGTAVGVKDLPQDGTKAFDSVKVIEKLDVTGPSKTSIGDMHVLVVEDNEINRKVMAAQLRRLGAHVHVAEHGLDALDFLSTTTYLPNTHGGTPLSLILLDVEMPICDGLACIRQIRQLEERGEISGHIPVIAITANARSEQITAAIEAGMDEVVTKPFKIRDLVPRMESLVGKWQAVG